MISIENLAFTYPDGSRALDGLTLEIRKGTAAGIVGANGAGKSTLVNHLNGYLLPQEGLVRIDGIGVEKRNREAIHRIVGLLFQNPDDQLFTARVYDDLLFGPRNLDMDMNSATAESERLLREFGLWELRDKPPSHLSHGQKRFAALATVLVMKPRVLVMDEPTSDLDPRNRRKLIDLVRNFQATTVTVSHDLDFIWETCNEVFIMNAGKIVDGGPARELLSNRDLLERNGLELPLRLQGV
ncbi:MAG: ABC transporter ATP-binding protein [Chlorobiaceae bacterium]|nr:ABC transporter ATP-binding protein [Chlorobiaceae bacterium]NTW74394.1 ABC transporter ATP-binding protein [Chlorobiaceae bacterium]